MTKKIVFVVSVALVSLTAGCSRTATDPCAESVAQGAIVEKYCRAGGPDVRNTDAAKQWLRDHVAFKGDLQQPCLQKAYQVGLIGNQQELNKWKDSAEGKLCVVVLDKTH